MNLTMHPADIAAAVKKRGTTMSAVSIEAGLSRAAISVALLQPFRRAEEAIISFLGLPPHHVFPDRYDTHGTRLVQHGGRAHRKRLINTSARPRAKGQ